MSKTITLSPPRGGRTRSRRSIALAALATVGAAVAFAVPVSPAAAADFNADPGSLGAIPDPGVLDVDFNVTGTAGAVADVKVSITIFNDRVGDLRGTLVAPNGASLLIFQGPPGDTTDVAGSYRFTDSASSAPTWQGAAASATLLENMPEGDYRASNAGGVNILITPAFAGLANANGLWTLRIEDTVDNNSGGLGVTGASLDIDTAECDGQPATIAGTDAGDVIFGTDGKDVIVAGGGDDIVRGLGGDDVVCGGDGDDKLKGGAGNDRLFGEAGSDKLRGGLDSDYCNGGSSRDSAKKCEKSKSI